MNTVNDYICSNDSDLEVIVSGGNPLDDCDPYAPEYFRGFISEIPEELRSCEVLYHAWSLDDGFPVIVIPYQYGEASLFKSSLV